MVRGGGYDANLSPWTLTFFSPLTQGVRCDAYSLARLMTSLRLLVRFVPAKLFGSVRLAILALCPRITNQCEKCVGVVRPCVLILVRQKGFGWFFGLVAKHGRRASQLWVSHHGSFVPARCDVMRFRRKHLSSGGPRMCKTWQDPWVGLPDCLGHRPVVLPACREAACTLEIVRVSISRQQRGARPETPLTHPDSRLSRQSRRREVRRLPWQLLPAVVAREPQPSPRDDGVALRDIVGVEAAASAYVFSTAGVHAREARSEDAKTKSEQCRRVGVSLQYAVSTANSAL